MSDCGRPHQSGMEQEHEKIVLDLVLVNFLNNIDVPFFQRDSRGEKTGLTYDVKARLGLAVEKMKSLIAAKQRAARELTDQKKETTRWAYKAGRMAGVLFQLTEKYKASMSEEELAHVKELLESDPPPQLGRSGSGSPSR